MAEELQKSYVTLYSDLTKTTEELNKRDNTIDYLQNKVDELQQKTLHYDSMMTQHQELSSAYSSLQAELKTSEMERAHLEHTIVQYDAKLNELEAAREGLDYDKLELDNKYKNLLLEYNLLEESYKHKEKELLILNMNAKQEQEFLHNQIDTKERMIQTMHSINKELHTNIEITKVHKIPII